MIRILSAFIILIVALGASAQSDEFGRASGGSISAITKAPSRLSGSLSLSQSFGGSGYGGTLGGEILKDRLWFFAGASILPEVHFAQATAQPVDWTTVTASISHSEQPMQDLSLPSSFLSLRSTSILSDRMTLDVSVTRSTH